MAIGRISDIDLRWLYVFIEVVQSGGYSTAQAKLNIGLATISAHMKSLEARLGVKLCQRGRAGFKLTDEGKLVYEEALLLNNAMQRFASISQSMGAELAGNLNIGMADATTNSGNLLVSHAIRRFNAREHLVHIRLHIDPRQELERGVLEGHCDLAIGFFATHYSGLEVHPLYTEVHALYCGQGHSLFDSRKNLSKVDLPNMLISARRFAGVDDCVRLGSQNRGATVDNLEAQLTLLLSGSYLGYLPIQYAQPWVERGMLHRLKSTEFTYKSNHVLISRQKKSLTRQTQLFIKDLLESAKQGY